VTTYADSSALVALYVPQRFSKSARAAVRKAGQIPFNALHRLEVPECIRAARRA
jgi:predicted nucleic acid-binding protein